MVPYTLDQRPGRILKVDGKEYLYFSGTSYLGIDQVPEYEACLLDCIRRYGFNHGLSRVNNLRLKVFDEFEGFFAEHATAAAAAVMSSGYLSGVAAWQYLYPQADLVWIAPGTHPAIVPSHLESDLQLNFTQWKNQCLQLSSVVSPQKILILGNAVDPLKAEIHAYDWVVEIAEKHKVSLLIDDSHAFGVLGKGVFGTYCQHSVHGIDLVVSGSLGKGLAMPAGIILGGRATIEGIKAQAIFNGASPAPPANLQAFLETQTIYSQKVELIRAYCGIFDRYTRDLSTVQGSAAFPVFILKTGNWPEKLEKLGFVTSSFSYPTAQSPKVNRIVISGGHRISDLEKMSEALHQISKNNGETI